MRMCNNIIFFMKVKQKNLLIFNGNDRTGKTTIQKHLLKDLCGQSYKRLVTNIMFDIIHPDIKKKYKNASFGNRSFQEKKKKYISVENYFKNFFRDADVAFISSHLVIEDIKQMIDIGKSRSFEVIGVFFSNSIKYNPVENSQISLLNWDKRLKIKNSVTNDSQQIDLQLKEIAHDLINHLSNKI